MKEYFTALLYASLAGGIATALVGKPYEKYLKYLAALICTAIIATPLIKLVPTVSFEKPQYQTEDTEYPDLVAEQGAEDGETALYNYIFSQTGIKAGDVCIEIERQGEQLYITAVRVQVAESETAKVEALMAELFGNAVEIEVYT